MKNSEPIMARYLLENRFNAQYERRIGGSDPDFSVWDTDGTPFAFWDVADRQFSALDQAEADLLIERLTQGLPADVERGPTKGYDFVRAKLFWKWDQFKKAAPVPGMLVLAEWTGRAQIEPEMMAAALHGWPQMKPNVGGTRRGVSFGRADDGKLAEAGEDYAYISAIGILKYLPTNRFEHGLEQFSKDVLEKFSDNLEHALGLISREEQRQRSMGIDLDAESPVLDIYLIDGAHHPWPRELRGKYDRLYVYDRGTSHYDLIVDGHAPAEPIPIPASETQKIIWEIASQPGLRNDD